MNDELVEDTRWLIKAVQRGLGRHGGEGAPDVLQRLSEQDLSPAAGRDPESRSLPVCRYLAETIAASMFVDAGLSAAMAACAEAQHWRQTSGYSDALLGRGFMDDYGHCELIGPHGVFPGSDFMLGMLLLGPLRHYRDHYHPAPELYWPLTGPTFWKRGDGPFAEIAAGATIWHPPNIVHATRTGDTPMLAIWAWTQDIATNAKLAGS